MLRLKEYLLKVITMSSIWVSNLDLEHTTKFFDLRGDATIERTINNTHIKHRKSQDHGGIFVGKSGFIVADGYCYDQNFNTMADALDNNISNIIEMLNTVNGDYSLYLETDRYRAVATDAWKTKQIFVSFDPDGTFCVCSVPDMIRITNRHAYPVGPNTLVVFDKMQNSVITHTIKKFDLSQTVTNHTKLFDAFDKGVAWRYDKGSVSTLSSGYDSGVIACALSNSGHKNFSVGFVSTEDKKIIKERMEIHKGKILPENNKLTDTECDDLKSIYLQEEIFSEAGEAIARVCKYMNKIGKSNILSGNGGDEMYSDYGFHGKQLANHSLFGGYFPAMLNVIWPWHEYTHRQSQLVSRIDLLAGYFGIQHKEPLLDVNVVQAWLNTTQDLKNKRYKNWMYEYMKDHNYPISKDVKIGFAGPERKLGNNE